MKQVEIVCLGNNGRSPLLEAVLKEEQKRKKFVGQFEITSSGLYVIKKHPYPLRQQTLEKARNHPNRDIFGKDKKNVTAFLDTTKNKDYTAFSKEERERFEHYFNQMYTLYQNLDVTFRNMVLEKNGLHYEGTQDQYPSRQHLDLVLTATTSLVEEAERNKPSPHTIITSIGDVTNTEDIKGGFGKVDMTFYDNMLAHAQTLAPRIIEYILETN